ncbi:MAG: hypothetical protein KJZ66_11515, partial [Candidatus Kuenenia stuttgartiensis]|nr:hypothetical protein [Candidatus Kuenenia stuttgartiensis]
MRDKTAAACVYYFYFSVCKIKAAVYQNTEEKETENREIVEGEAVGGDSRLLAIYSLQFAGCRLYL